MKVFPSPAEVRVLSPGLIEVMHDVGSSPFQFAPGEVRDGLIEEIPLGASRVPSHAEPKVWPLELWCRHRQPVHGVVDGRHFVSLKDPPFAELLKTMNFDELDFDQGLKVSVRQVHSKFSFSGGALAHFLRENTAKSPQVALNETSPVAHGWHLMVSVFEDRIYWGIGRSQGLFSSRLGGSIHYPADQLPYSRAASKLLEAFEVFDISPPGPKGREDALDLGAAPGGWTGVLLGKGYQRVYAVDPAELDPLLKRDPRVFHIKDKAEHLRLKPETIALMVCDANWKMEATIKSINKLKKFLRPKGEVILTIKLMGSYQRADQDPKARREVWESLDLLQENLQDSYRILGLRQLFHNRHEVTAYLRKI